ncbi:MAG: hypothetical protein F6K32_11420 [Desertifilum sp. SIO1I2]|nr:hypothetical protein [Desertifilum sp. SIO1I2]
MAVGNRSAFSPMTELCYPHLGLFSYTLTEGEENTNSLTFIPEDATDRESIEGFNYLCNLGDTEGLLTLYFIADEPHHHPQPLSYLHKLKQQINTNKIHQKTEQISPDKKIGKTWIILGILPSFLPDSKIDCIAQEAAKIFDFDQQILLEPQKFMGATIYELWTPPDRWQDLNKKNNHLVIILYPDKEKLDTFDQFKQDWMRLFYYRNKILWAYNNSVQTPMREFLKKNLLPSDFTITQQLNPYQSGELEVDLDQLRQLLKKNYLIAKHYSQCLIFLEVQLQTLQTNFYNYQERRNSLVKKAQVLGTTDDNLLQSFIEIPAQRYQLQLEKDIAALSPGLRGRDTFINTIRGMVDIEQAKSDRNLNYIIAGASIGLATSGVTATILSTQVYQPENTTSERISVFQGFLRSLFPIFLIMGIGIIIWDRRRQARKDKR